VPRFNQHARSSQRLDRACWRPGFGSRVSPDLPNTSDGNRFSISIRRRCPLGAAGSRHDVCQRHRRPFGQDALADVVPVDDGIGLSRRHCSWAARTSAIARPRRWPRSSVFLQRGPSSRAREMRSSNSPRRTGASWPGNDGKPRLRGTREARQPTYEASTPSRSRADAEGLIGSPNAGEDGHYRWLSDTPR
jgi:hypothetical protein